MSFKYCCISEGNTNNPTTVAEFPSAQEQPSLVATMQRVLEAAHRSPQVKHQGNFIAKDATGQNTSLGGGGYVKKTIEDKENGVNYFYLVVPNNNTTSSSNAGSRVYGCVATAAAVASPSSHGIPQRVAYAFLDDLESSTRQILDSATADSAAAGGNSKKLSSSSSSGAVRTILQSKVAFYNDPKNDKISALHSDIQVVTTIMMDNMDEALKRGDNLTTLHGKATQLSEQSKTFNDKSEELRREMCWRHVKVTVLIIVVVFVLLLIVVLAACKPNFSDCSK